MQNYPRLLHFHPCPLIRDAPKATSHYLWLLAEWTLRGLATINRGETLFVRIFVGTTIDKPDIVLPFKRSAPFGTLGDSNSPLYPYQLRNCIL